ncbi:MAG: BrnT family toxin [Candidatus Schekmanbacteria bacterium]|nr:BrnT family toxin [Candidatus Schekmanbacteria bacterium]
MVRWDRFLFSDFAFDEGIEEKLARHGIRFYEAVECFYNPFKVRRNKQFDDRFQLQGITDAGRRLNIIFQLKPKGAIRIITGWEI